MRCQSCNVAIINGIRCHETGCPGAPRECCECGCAFKPAHPFHTVCPDCCEAIDEAFLREAFGADE